MIGGSLAGAIRAHGLARRVVGVGRDPRRLALAHDLGLVDEVCTSLSEAAADADLIIFCTPVDKIVAGVREAAAHCRPGTLITDAGSVKRSICRELAVGLPVEAEFVGSHPLAGGEKQGCEHADPQLFEGRRCVITPIEGSSPRAVEQIAALWSSLGCRVLRMSPEAHDEAVARSSHIPHIAAAALATSLRPVEFPLAATGFRDTTRIAGGDPGLWTSILLENASEIVEGLRGYESLLADFRGALERHDETAIRDLLARGRDNRDKWRRVFVEATEAVDGTFSSEDPDALGS